MAPSSNPDYDSTIAGFLDKVESAVYLLVSIFLVLLALMTLIIVGKDMASFVSQQYGLDTLVLVLNDLLVTLIIAELIQTVIVYFKSHKLELKLILAAGLTAMIRHILVFGVEKSITWEDMAVTALLILVIIVGIYLIGEKKVST
ncbi:MAG TPA: phosphate-starvation-inducible PsiE family protein [Methanocella sp.]|uniref:phosphate-starvation-inducible PsiE family protein n=1 Tax=Methanocella sp. TaxID=2052833 RepID=UPI002CDB57D4|nr:phosphate-starvation-inducible PsiE family protein [Methanocella sp.]HTY90635.1 phosphate-starvation-inducible PsiE family protein [Methanocella sp.]